MNRFTETFIELTRHSTKAKLSINYFMISELEPAIIGENYGTNLTMMNGNTYFVDDSVLDIEKKIKSAGTIRIQYNLTPNSTIA